MAAKSGNARALVPDRSAAPDQSSRDAGPDAPHDHASATEQEPAHDDHGAMLRRWIWRDFANITLGVWLIAAPLTSGASEPAMFWSDIASGALIVILATLTLSPRFDLARWGLCGVGIWLMFAPLIFWTQGE